MKAVKSMTVTTVLYRKWENARLLPSSIRAAAHGQRRVIPTCILDAAFESVSLSFV